MTAIIYDFALERRMRMLRDLREFSRAYAEGRAPKAVTKKHAPKCRACRKPGHYAPACPDDEARSRFYEAEAAKTEARKAALLASFAERGIR